MKQIANKDQLRIIEEFVADLESSLGVKQSKVSFDALWNDFPPHEADGQSLMVYMKDVSLLSLP